MKLKSIQSDSVRMAQRLDCWYFLSPATVAAEAIDRAKQLGMTTDRLQNLVGPSRIWAPARFKRAYAAEGEPRAPYLRPYDVFNYFPEAADWLSTLRTKDIDSYRLRNGTILQTCSGRNLGPAVMVDSHLAGFLLSHDMIRIEAEDTEFRHFLLAFLNSHTGRRLLRRDKTGSVIDHISEEHLEKLEIPRLKPRITRVISSMVANAVERREMARTQLRSALDAYESKLPSLTRTAPLRRGWTVSSEHISGRIDAAFYDPLKVSMRKSLRRLGGMRVGDLATVSKPGGRYKTCYVDADNGRPLLSGAQLLQSSLINLQFIAPRVFKNIGLYELKEGWLAYPADGRAEEELGTPVLITRDRSGWLASGHVGRIIPNVGVDAGWLFLALKTSHAQLQIKAAASGSVVDSTFERDMEDVVLPPKLDVDGSAMVRVWEMFREAQELEDKASGIVDKAISEWS
jgi:hypothetical protein